MGWDAKSAIDVCWVDLRITDCVGTALCLPVHYSILILTWIRSANLFSSVLEIACDSVFITRQAHTH